MGVEDEVLTGTSGSLRLQPREFIESRKDMVAISAAQGGRGGREGRGLLDASRWRRDGRQPPRATFPTDQEAG